MSAPRHALRVIKKSARIALRRSPVLKVGAAVRDGVRSGVATGRDTLVDSVLMPAAHGSAARVRYAAVLDGHTLNLHAELPAGTPEDAPARLVLAQGATELRADARTHRDDAGRPCVSATVLLGDTIGGLPLGTGRWTLALELDAAPAPVRLRLLGDGAPGFSGPTRALAVCPHTGRRHHMGITASGQLRLTVAPAVSRAEVLRIERSFTGAGLLFAVHGPAADATRGARPVVEVVEQQRRRVLRRTAEPLPGDDSAWRVSVPLADMTGTSGRQVWTFRLPVRNRRGRALDLGRRDHDLRTPRKVLTPAAFTVRAADGTFVQVKPQYTRRGALQLVCTPRTSVTP
ncbi:hypothetical protein [Streptomyces morookaense]|uniref:Uncharacterized protein n=1 Tax=Streptomyces morookaense TaxID=1970 RepID=A0A7Y7B486_STRMO|nr:hypothetical protein [Streptomyces morookaense]NVK78549.1 hypothetical protein [Streptomyces morookaense]GHF33219.1 hypothetical protein GCM10010359_39930 [Streptomyces morookaense]